MSKCPDLQQTPVLPSEIIQAGLNGELVLFVGAGISRLLDLPSWRGLAEQALELLRAQEIINYSELSQLSRLDPRKQLSIARHIAEENEVKLDLKSLLEKGSDKAGIYKFINDIGCVCVTTNYDEFLSPNFIDSESDDSTPLGEAKPTRIYSKDRFLSKLLDQPGTVVHLHGAISDPDSMILTTKDYLEHYDFEKVQTFLGDLFANRTVLFIGYGLEESEILEHILRRGSVKGADSTRRRFSLQGFFVSEDPLYKQLHKYYEKSFGVHLIGFERDHQNYDQQVPILKDWSERIKVNKPPLTAELQKLNEVMKDG